MSDATSRGHVGCAKVAGYGCLGLVLFAVVAGVGIWASWDLLRESGFGRGLRDTLATVKAESETLQGVRARLLADYPAADARPNVQIQSTNGVTVKTLQITLVDPRFELADGDAAQLAQAREIARAAAAAHPDIDRYDRLRLIVVRTARDGAATTTTSTSTWEFSAGEL